MHITQSEFVTGEVKLTLDYRTNGGLRRVTMLFTGDDIGAKARAAAQPARNQALELLTEFVNTARGDIDANPPRITWRGI